MSQETTILPLPSHIVSQIAAGEVIERPCFVVKELIDNSIDAQASLVSIDLQESGMHSIIVTDNGAGMSREDLLESYKLHTTSKIHDEHHLHHIKTLGFRGEALASIASVSTITIESKRAQDIAGNKIQCIPGKPVIITTLGMPSGTRVIVNQLFSNKPVRKKFITNKKIELKKIIEVVTGYASMYPEISFILSHEGQIIHQFDRADSLLQRIEDIYGLSISSHFIPFSFNEAHIDINGYISTPQLISSNIPYQIIGVNGRPVIDKLITSTVKTGYGSLVEHNATPSFVLLIQVSPEMIDVNIHPRKERVKFVQEQTLHELLLKHIKTVLSSQSLVYQGLPHVINDAYEDLTYTTLSNQLKKRVLPKKAEQLTTITLDHHLLQIHNLYIVAQTNEGMTIIDQHAAHERILYEQFYAQFVKQQHEKEIQQLEEPILFECTNQESILLNTYIDQLTMMGFEIDEFHTNTFKISTIPRLFEGRNTKALLQELLQEFTQDLFAPSIDTGSKKLISYLSCRSAVKSGDPLTLEQMKMIVSELQKIPHAVTCPHGRPLRYIVSLTELHKIFKRK